ncbi:MAG: hypothetical protein KAS32_25555 [Candidatus Peribacteraceae bacterium]|nr:hypothetical protein [Candidatus Peribacteraceae bacterium]
MYYVAIDQYGTMLRLRSVKRKPRKALLDALGAISAKKMYQDTVDGISHQVGYIIRGYWYTIYECHQWEGKC